MYSKVRLLGVSFPLFFCGIPEPLLTAWFRYSVFFYTFFFRYLCCKI